jgi:hypothetical protein
VGPFALLLACFLVGAGGAGIAVAPAAVISSNGLDNDDSSVNVGDKPRVGSKLASPNAYASELTVNKSGSCIFGCHSSVTGYVINSFSQLEVLQCNDILNGVFGLPGTPQLRCQQLRVQMIGCQGPMAVPLRPGHRIEVRNKLRLTLTAEGVFEGVKRRCGVVTNAQFACGGV